MITNKQLDYWYGNTSYKDMEDIFDVELYNQETFEAQDVIVAKLDKQWKKMSRAEKLEYYKKGKSLYE
jgi:hypothetical protein